jgi:hypothetical protein
VLYVTNTDIHGGEIKERLVLLKIVLKRNYWLLGHSWVCYSLSYNMYFTHNDTVPSTMQLFLLLPFHFSFHNIFRPHRPSSGALICQNCYTLLNATHSLHM